MGIILGLIIGIGGIIFGNFLEDGHLSSLIQFTAAVIVFGGTLGAVIVSNDRKSLNLALSSLKLIFKRDDELKDTISKEIIESAKIARKDSILKIETRLENFEYPFMKEVFRYMVDGVGAETLEDIFTTRIDNEEERNKSGARVWEDAGGYSPTIGIIGAVLGLIHVMGNLTNTSALGQGIAVAFVATIYGVGAANLIFLPIAARLKRRAEEQSQTKFMVVDGAISILSGLNPYLIEEKMASYTGKEVDLIDIQV